MSKRETGEARFFSTLPTRQAINILEEEGFNIVTVTGWSRKMGYDDATNFSDSFRREFGQRPQPVLIAFRVKKAIQLLREDDLSNYKIARKLKLRNEKGLYQFINHHTAYAPTDIVKLSKQEYRILLKRLEKKIIE